MTTENVICVVAIIMANFLIPTVILFSGFLGSQKTRTLKEILNMFGVFGVGAYSVLAFITWKGAGEWSDLPPVVAVIAILISVCVYACVFLSLLIECTQRVYNKIRN